MYIENSEVNLDMVIFENNSAIRGGAIFSSCDQYNEINIKNSIFRNNQATESGGAIRNIDCNLSTINTTFTNNDANYGDNFLGYPQSIILH